MASCRVTFSIFPIGSVVGAIIISVEHAMKLASEVGAGTPGAWSAP